MRGDWQLREVSICLRHSHALAPLWSAGNLIERFDIGARLAEIGPNILNGALNLPSIAPSAYDRWLDGRLKDGRDETWFAGHSLYAATTLCRLLGAELVRIHGPSGAQEPQALRAAQAAGFAVARQGETAIRATLQDFASQAAGAADTPHKAFGQLFVKLSRDHLHDDDFAPFRALLREQILETWPIAAGEPVLGEAQAVRRRHSVKTAAHEAGVGTPLLEQFLVEAGAIAETDDRPVSRKTFNPQQFAALLAEIPQLVGKIEIQNAMGATEREFATLIKEGMLLPRTAIATIKSRWRLSDGLEFVAELQRKAVDQIGAEGTWESLQLARQRTNLPIRKIIEAIHAGQIDLVQRPDINGYHGFAVRKDQIDTIANLSDPMAGSGLIPAAQFGRSIGLRGKDGFLAFLAAGHSPAQQMRHPQTGTTWLYLSAADIAAFHQRFETLSTLAERSGEHRNRIRARLKAAGLSPFTPDGASFGNIYLREQVARVEKLL